MVNNPSTRHSTSSPESSSVPVTIAGEVVIFRLLDGLHSVGLSLRQNVQAGTLSILPFGKDTVLRGLPAGAKLNAEFCQRIVALYRSRAWEALTLSKEAREGGSVYLALGYIDEAQAWTQFASSWEQRATRADDSQPTSLEVCRG